MRLINHLLIAGILLSSLRVPSQVPRPLAHEEPTFIQVVSRPTKRPTEPARLPQEWFPYWEAPVLEKPKEILTVRVTFYIDRGKTRYGCPTLPGMAATDPEVIPPGTFFRLRGWPDLFYACDTGDLVRGRHVDLWMPSEEKGKEFIRRVGERAEIEIIRRQ
jgi:3D (Asp-Asp-Asp) domain-containing protein